jgi:LDH2 family malate/lactate/ureidoglycolate dehydrogenase
MSETQRLTLDEVHALTTAVLLENGVSPAQTRAVADTVTAAERDDCKSHGLFRVPGYVAGVRSGKVVRDAVPQVHDVAPGVARVDARRGFAPLALEVGAGALAEKARAQGVALLAVTDCYHFAALWPEVERLASEGLVAFAFTQAMAYVAPAGGVRPLYGTNPMAFGWPRVGAPPVVFDQASSASARGEIQIHLRDGKPLPEGWAIDAEGRPTTDPAAALEGAQLPFGGYKGAAIAMMVELLAGALVGDRFSFEVSAEDNRDGGPPIGGELMIAIEPSRPAAGGAASAVLAHAEALFEKILEQEGARLPSDRRYRARERTPQSGIEIPRSLHDTIVGLRRD